MEMRAQQWASSCLKANLTSSEVQSIRCLSSGKELGVGESGRTRQSYRESDGGRVSVDISPEHVEQQQCQQCQQEERGGDARKCRPGVLRDLL